MKMQIIIVISTIVPAIGAIEVPSYSTLSQFVSKDGGTVSSFDSVVV